MDELEKVYMLKTTIGKGTDEDPVRIVIKFYPIEGGECIGEIDNFSKINVCTANILNCCKKEVQKVY